MGKLFRQNTKKDNKALLTSYQKSKFTKKNVGKQSWYDDEFDESSDSSIDVQDIRNINTKPSTVINESRLLQKERSQDNNTKKEIVDTTPKNREVIVITQVNFELPSDTEEVDQGTLKKEGENKTVSKKETSIILGEDEVLDLFNNNTDEVKDTTTREMSHKIKETIINHGDNMDDEEKVSIVESELVSELGESEDKGLLNIIESTSNLLEASIDKIKEDSNHSSLNIQEDKKDDVIIQEDKKDDVIIQEDKKEKVIIQEDKKDDVIIQEKTLLKKKWKYNEFLQIWEKN